MIVRVAVGFDRLKLTEIKLPQQKNTNTKNMKLKVTQMLIFLNLGIEITWRCRGNVPESHHQNNESSNQISSQFRSFPKTANHALACFDFEENRHTKETY